MLITFHQVCSHRDVLTTAAYVMNPVVKRKQSNTADTIPPHLGTINICFSQVPASIFYFSFPRKQESFLLLLGMGMQTAFSVFACKGACDLRHLDISSS